MSESDKNASKKPDKITDEKLDAVVPKLIRPLRMLSSGVDGEILAAVYVVLRVLAAAGLDIHALVSRIEHGKDYDGKLTAAEVQAIYDKGFTDGHSKGAEQGRRSAVIAAAKPMSVIDTSDVGPGVNGYSWEQIAQHLAAHEHLFSGNTLDFVRDMPTKIALYGCPTAKRANWLRDLFMQKFGGRI